MLWATKDVSILQMCRLNCYIQYIFSHQKLFQYFKCVGWIFWQPQNICYYFRVSILQMCRLNLEVICLAKNTGNDYVSILQMCRLNLKNLHHIKHLKSFQYFKCVGWILGSKTFVNYVPAFQYFKCVGWIIIDLGPITKEPVFQYFKCVGWMQ